MRYLLLFLWLVGCDSDPARSVKIIARPAAGPMAHISVSPANWHPNGCPPVREGSAGPSRLAVTGPCAFAQQATAKCSAKVDDFFVIVERQAANGGKMTVYINVESYHGPDHYLTGQVYLTLPDGDLLYRWSNDKTAVVVGPDGAYVELQEARLAAEPLLRTCSPVVSADGSFHFPCNGKHEESPVDGTVEVLSGKIICAK